MNGKKLNIGLFGFGTVGRGLYDVLKRIGSKNLEIKRVCVRDLTKDRGRSPPYSLAKGTPCATHWSMMLLLTSARR